MSACRSHQSHHQADVCFAKDAPSPPGSTQVQRLIWRLNMHSYQSAEYMASVCIFPCISCCLSFLLSVNLSI